MVVFATLREDAKIKGGGGKDLLNVSAFTDPEDRDVLK